MKKLNIPPHKMRFDARQGGLFSMGRNPEKRIVLVPEMAEKLNAANAAITAYIEAMQNAGVQYTHDHSAAGESAGARTVITDLIADLVHLARHHGWPANEIVNTALDYVREEADFA